MNELTAEFFVKDEVEYVSISGSFMGKDVVTRAATDADRSKYADAYAVFKAPPPVQAP